MRNETHVWVLGLYKLSWPANGSFVYVDFLKFVCLFVYFCLFLLLLFYLFIFFFLFLRGKTGT